MSLDPAFYDAFREQARLLVPERPVLLALVRLYSWLAANRLEQFEEKQLREFLARGEADALVGEEEASLYTPWQRHSAIIRELQAYWLLRGVGAAAATYSLQPHARAFCKRLHTTLFSKLVVSQVEASFQLLRQGLAEDEGNVSGLVTGIFTFEPRCGATTDGARKRHRDRRGAATPAHQPKRG